MTQQTPTVAQLLDAARLDCIVIKTARENGKRPPKPSNNWLAHFIPGEGREPLAATVAAVVAETVASDELPRTVGAARAKLRRYVRANGLV